MLLRRRDGVDALIGPVQRYLLHIPHVQLARRHRVGQHHQDDLDGQPRRVIKVQQRLHVPVGNGPSQPGGRRVQQIGEFLALLLAFQHLLELGLDRPGAGRWRRRRSGLVRIDRRLRARRCLVRLSVPLGRLQQTALCPVLQRVGAVRRAAPDVRRAGVGIKAPLPPAGQPKQHLELFGSGQADVLVHHLRRQGEHTGHAVGIPAVEAFHGEGLPFCLCRPSRPYPLLYRIRPARHKGPRNISPISSVHPRLAVRGRGAGETKAPFVFCKYSRFYAPPPVFPPCRQYFRPGLP